MKIISKHVTEHVFQSYVYTVLELYGDRHPMLLSGCTKESTTEEARTALEDLGNSRFPNSESAALEFVEYWMQHLLTDWDKYKNESIWDVVLKDLEQRAKRICRRSIDDAWRTEWTSHEKN